MRSMFIGGIATMLLTTAAFAQPENPPTAGTSTPDPAVTAPAAKPAPAPATLPSDKAPSNPAVKTSEGNNPGAPVAGANSFTEGQAKSRIESMGYSGVSALTKDDRGVWRGMAQKDGKPVEVALDYQGNVVVR